MEPNKYADLLRVISVQEELTESDQQILKEAANMIDYLQHVVDYYEIIEK